ncbi:GHMP kinase [Streptomyces sp. NPDC057695]|uniref:GHMP family kinase ATP-binding protein n=1 Tax=Streptomyces sp. NPDC057695 TaxID=3346217 RepID=UPI00369FC087
MIPAPHRPPAPPAPDPAAAPGGDGTPGSAGTGAGHAPCHHGELLQGVFLDAHGNRCAGLVTLPLDGPGSRAEFVPRPGAPARAVTVTPADRGKAGRAAALAVAECAALAGLPPAGGELRLTSDVPMGLGMGSSTSDVIAAIRAVADAYGLRLAPGAVARLAVHAERASDPLMLDARPVLFAQREGRVLEVLGPALPPLVVVGCVLGGGAPVDTLALPVREASDTDVQECERLRALLRDAVARGDARLLARVATASARRGQRVLRHPEFDDLVAVARHTGAAGVQIAHSGAVAGVLFDPAVPDDLRRRVHRCRNALHGHGIPTTRTFTTPAPNPGGTPTAASAPSVTSKELPDGPAHRRGDRTARPDTPRRPSRLPAL